MKQMTDPMDALRSMQDCLASGEPLNFQQCVLHRGMRVLMDRPAGELRLSYVLADGARLKALCLFSQSAPIEGVPCFGVGYAVAKKFRRQGLGRTMLENCIAELSHGMRGKGGPRFYLEAVVAVDNVPSRKIAERVISSTPTAGTDGHSGQPVLAFQRLVVL